MRVKTFTILALFTLVLFGNVANAGIDSYVGTAVIAISTSSTTCNITMNDSEIKDLLVFIPTLDSGTSGTIAMTQTILSDTSAKSGVAIRGYSTKSFTSTQDKL